MEPSPLTHLDAGGAARMVDVADRPATDRSATAEGYLRMTPSTLALVLEGAAPKGDVLAVARVAAIQGAKRTAELIPLCHSLPLAGVTVSIAPSADGLGLRLEASTRTTAPTGVEMEALTAVQIGLLTLYDMLKAADPAMTIGPVRLLEKHGGRHGSWRHPGQAKTPWPAAMAEPFPPEGLPLAMARERVLATLTPLDGLERRPLAACLGRVSAEACVANEAVPGFRGSIMDGYAVADGAPPAPGARWRLVGRSAPGLPFPGVLAEGETIRVLTGATLPDGAARVLPQELVQQEGDTLVLCGEAGLNPWIRAADEEAAPGQRLLEAGVRLGPAHLGRLASCGVATLAVRRRPRVGLLINGDELVAAGTPRSPGTIWESNGTLLEALLVRLGHGVAERRVVADEPVALAAALTQLAAGCDVVVSTGGVSAGDADWIRPLLEEMGTVDFWKLFLRPGRPFAFGQLGGKPFFGLPGNPVAAAITALQLLWPALEALEGTEPALLPRLQVQLETALKRSPGRPELARARLVVGAGGELLARVEGSQASSRIGSLQGADLLLEIPADQGHLEAGTRLWAQLLRLPLL